MNNTLKLKGNNMKKNKKMKRTNELKSPQSKEFFWLGFLWSFLTGILLGAVILLTMSMFLKHNEAEKKEVWRGYKISIAWKLFFWVLLLSFFYITVYYTRKVLEL